MEQDFLVPIRNNSPFGAQWMNEKERKGKIKRKEKKKLKRTNRKRCFVYDKKNNGKYDIWIVTLSNYPCIIKKKEKNEIRLTYNMPSRLRVCFKIFLSEAIGRQIFYYESEVSPRSSKRQYS